MYRYRRLALLATAFAAVLSGLLAAPAAQTAPPSYRIFNTAVGNIDNSSFNNVSLLDVGVTFSCPAGAVIPLSVRLDGITLFYDGAYGTGTEVVSRTVFFGETITCTGARQTLTRSIDSATSPLVLRLFRPSRHVQVTTTLGPLTDARQVNLR
jgi:hypothetical protein